MDSHGKRQSQGNGQRNMEGMDWMPHVLVSGSKVTLSEKV